MIKYKKIYLDAYGYNEGDFIRSELSDLPAVEFNHILCIGMGGSKNRELDRIENLIAVTRNEHIDYGDKKQYYSYLFRIHKLDMMINGVKFDHEWIDKQIEKYRHYEL